MCLAPWNDRAQGVATERNRDGDEGGSPKTYWLGEGEKIFSRPPAPPRLTTMDDPVAFLGHIEAARPLLSSIEAEPALSSSAGRHVHCPVDLHTLPDCQPSHR